MNNLEDHLNNKMMQTHAAEKKAEELLNKYEGMKAVSKKIGKTSISNKDISKVYGKNWKKSLACIPLEEDAKKRDKKKAKQARKSRKMNRKKK